MLAGVLPLSFHVLADVRGAAQLDDAISPTHTRIEGRAPMWGSESSQVSTLPKAKSKTRSKQNKDMRKCSSVYSKRGVPLPVLTSGGE
jgi:hypothetical protein